MKTVVKTIVIVVLLFCAQNVPAEMKHYGNWVENDIGNGVYTLVLEKGFGVNMTPDLWADAVAGFVERHPDRRVKAAMYLPYHRPYLIRAGIILITEYR